MLFQFGGQFGRGFFQGLERFGFIDAIFPFALVFTIVYGILRKIQIFGKDASNRFDLIIALVTGVAFVYPHVTGRYAAFGIADPVNIINQSIPQVGVIIIAIVMFLILIGLLGFKGKFGALQQIMALLAVVVVGYIFLEAAGWFTSSTMLRFLSNNPDLQLFIVIILVLGGLLWFLGEDRSGGENGGKRFTKFLDTFIGDPNK